MGRFARFPEPSVLADLFLTPVTENCDCHVINYYVGRLYRQLNTSERISGRTSTTEVRPAAFQLSYYEHLSLPRQLFIESPTSFYLSLASSSQRLFPRFFCSFPSLLKKLYFLREHANNVSLPGQCC